MEEVKIEGLKPSFFAIIPANVRYDERIGSTAKLLFAEITALSNVEGYCWASNNYFASLFKLSTTQISRLIGDLENKGFVKSFVDSKNGNQRKLYPQIGTDEKMPAIGGNTLEEKFDKVIGVLPVDLYEEKKAFLDYWTAKNDGGKKELWQMQKVFAIKQRWATWMKNKREWSAKKIKVPTDKEIRENAKRDVEKKNQETDVQKQLQEMSKPRTPEEQARIDARLAEMRKNLGKRFSMPSKI